MARARIFYIFTLREKKKKKDLQKFLETQWLPVLRDAPGCLEVELLDTYHDRAGYCVSELWENREIHVRSTTKLWRETHTGLMKKVKEYAAMEFLWHFIVLDA